MEMTDPNEITRCVVHIEGEHETPNGWLYTFQIEWADASTTDHELTLAWVDHEHLVGGGVSPSVIAKSAAKIAAAYFGSDRMPARCDVSTLAPSDPAIR